MKRTKFSNSVPVLTLDELTTQLSEEWNKPKQNIKGARKNTRSNKKIKELQKQITALKKKLK